MTLEARIKAGMAYLDVVYGEGWTQKVNVRTLNMYTTDLCILGQVDDSHSYGAAYRKLGLTDRSAFNLGFSSSDLTDIEKLFHLERINYQIVRNVDWCRLTEAWKQILEEVK